MPDPTPNLTAEERLSIRCSSCGRTVYAVPGDHTIAGGPPICGNAHVLRHKAFEAAAEAGRKEAMAIFNDCWSELKNSGDARHVIEGMSGFGERVASAILALAKEQADG